MNVLIMNCSPVKNGATAEIAGIISWRLKEKYNIINICIDDTALIFARVAVRAIIPQNVCSTMMLTK